MADDDAETDSTANIVLYGTDDPDGGCVQVWPFWPHPIPQSGDRISLIEGDWVVQYRRFRPSDDQVEVYATPP